MYVCERRGTVTAMRYGRNMVEEICVYARRSDSDRVRGKMR